MDPIDLDPQFYFALFNLKKSFVLCIVYFLISQNSIVLKNLFFFLIASEHGFFEIVYTLLQAGASFSINSVDSYGNSALMLGLYQILRIFLNMNIF